MKSLLMKKITGWAMMAHACNPSYSGGSDQEDHGSKPDQANSSYNYFFPLGKKNDKKRTGRVTILVRAPALSSNPSATQTTTTKKKQKEEN
jgi:hypothetical protein